jgi:hypothetical protein
MGKCGSCLNNLFPDRQLTGTVVLTGAAQQTLRKNILKMAGRTVCQFGCQQVQLSPGGERLPAGHPEDRTDNRTASAPGTVLFPLLVQNRRR